MLPPYPTCKIQPSLRKELEIAAGCLLTFNGDWLMNQLDWCELVRELQDSPSELELQARMRVDTMELFERFSKHTGCFGKWSNWQHWSVALEISLEAEPLGRVHLHVFVHFKEAGFPIAQKTMRFGFDHIHRNRQW